MPYCTYCTTLAEFVLHDLQLPERPSIPEHGQLRLSWPTSVANRLGKEDVPGGSLDAPGTYGFGLAAGSSHSEHDSATPSPCPFYEYDDLASGDEVRVLELSPGQPTDSLHAVLTKRRLRDFSAYEALSYTWACYDDPGSQHYGDTSPSQVMYLGDFWDPFPITRNCENALHRIRYPERKRHVWVDSICINQWNTKERGHQVGLMDRIYENALSVIVYLGAESSDSELAMQLLQQHKFEYVNESEKSSLQSLFERPYFTRMWVVQEIARAKALHFYCGHSDAFFSSFSKFPFDPDRPQSSEPPWFRYSRQQRLVQAKDLLSLLEDTSTCQCSDPRDRIFALLGLVTDAGEQGLEADYHLSIDQVYTGIAAFIVQADEGQIVRVLRLAVRSPTSISRPSWVPDWADEGMFLSPLHGKPHPYRRAEKPRLEFCPRVSSAGRLIVRGFLFSNPETVRKIIKSSTFDGHRGSQLSSVDNGFIESILMIPVESTILLLKLLGPMRNELREFSLCDVGEFHIVMRDGPENGPENGLEVRRVLELSRLPFSPAEHILIAGVLSRPSQFPCFRSVEGLWRTRLLEWIDERVSPYLYSRIRGPDGWVQLNDLVATKLSQQYEEEVRLWEQWQEYERRGSAILQHQPTLDAAFDQLRSMEESNDSDYTWDDFQEEFIPIDSHMRNRDNRWVAEFLSLFILEPRPPASSASWLSRFRASASWFSRLRASASWLSRFRTSASWFSRSARASAHLFLSKIAAVARARSPESTTDAALVADPLGLLQDWANVTLDLMAYLRDDHFLKRLGFPGGHIFYEASNTGSYHMRVADVVCKRKPKWYGWYTWFIASTIRRLRIEGKDIGLDEHFRGPIRKEAYWDWDKLKTVMNQRRSLWEELNQLREQLSRELAGVEEGSGIRVMEKIMCRVYIEEMDLPVGGMTEETVTIV